MPVTTLKAGQRRPLNVLGMPLTMLCEAGETGGSWSLFEEEVPLGMGPPPHRHDWDEAYYILDGEVDFQIDGESVKSAARRFQLSAARHRARLQGRVTSARASSSFSPHRRTAVSSSTS